MKALLLSSALLATGVAAATPAMANDHDDFDAGRPLTVAVFGDWPYNQNLLDNASLLTDSVNSDPRVSHISKNCDLTPVHSSM